MTIILKQRIMAGVYLLYIIRIMKSRFVGPLFVVAVFFVTLSFMVSIPHIISNLIVAHGSYAFVSDAFSKAGIVAKLLAVSSVVPTIFFVRNLGVYTTERIKERFI